MNNSPERLVSKVLEPGEQVIWTGRPQVEAAVSGHRRRRKVTLVVGIALVLVLTFWLLPESIAVNELVEAMEMKMLLPLLGSLVVIALFFIFKQDTASQLNRYFQGLSYAITDRRLLILEGDRISDSYTPERVSTPVLKQRQAGRADVIFGRRSSTTEGRRSVVNRERDEVGFKALSNAREVEAMIGKWLEDSLSKAEKEMSVEIETPSTQADSSSGRRRIENRKAGLALEVPAAWTTRVRNKKKPVGSFFFDREDWQSPEAAGNWNAVCIEGPAKCKVELEIFETAPTLTFESLNASKMADALAGEVVDSDPDIEINGIRGFSVTRRRELAVDPETNAAGLAAIVAPERRTVLHDGRRQIYILSSWPEDSPQLERAVDAVVKSIELD